MDVKDDGTSNFMFSLMDADILTNDFIGQVSRQREEKGERKRVREREFMLSLDPRLAW